MREGAGTVRVSGELTKARLAMRPLREYHHFKAELIEPEDRVTKCERYVADLLLTSDLPDLKRDSSICWELKHQASTLQFAKVLAMRRGLAVDLCAVGLMLHDVYSIIHGSYENHAHLGAPLAIDILREIGGFSEEELSRVWCIIYNHSDKHIRSQDPYEEIGKDVDILDCFLYEGAFSYYLASKSLLTFREYLGRAKSVWDELGLPSDPRFGLLEDYQPAWFQLLRTAPCDQMVAVLAVLLELSDSGSEQGVCPYPFCVVREGSATKLYGNQRKWACYAEDIAERSRASELDGRVRPLLTALSGALHERASPDAIDQDLFLDLQRMVSQEMSSVAEDLLLGRGNDSAPETCAWLFWPLLGIYEPVSGTAMTRRLDELGIARQANVERHGHEQGL
jgi:uncharacterized protein